MKFTFRNRTVKPASGCESAAGITVTFPVCGRKPALSIRGPKGNTQSLDFSLDQHERS